MLHANLKMVISLPNDKVDEMPFESVLGIEALVDQLTAQPGAADYKIGIRRTVHLALCGVFSDVLRRLSALFRVSPSGHRGRCTFIGDWHKAMVEAKVQTESTVNPSHPLAQLG